MEDEKRIYYVYEHIREDNGSCFYVGRGHGERAYVENRNALHDKVLKEHGCYVKIYKDKLTSQEASELEKERIKYYVETLHYGIDIKGYEGEDKDHFLTNRTWGGEDGCFKKGSENQQYGVSPENRMGSHYADWRKKTSDRLKAQVGPANPNYGNDTLHNKIKDDPELRIQYFSRPGAQNGRATKVDLYQENDGYVGTFQTINDASAYIKEILGIKTQILTIHSNLQTRSKKGKYYRGYQIRYCD